MLTRPRFKVYLCHGFLGLGLSRTRKEGVTATVVDLWYAHKVIVSFRSESRRGQGGNVYGIQGAIDAARDYAQELNLATDYS